MLYRKFIAVLLGAFVLIKKTQAQSCLYQQPQFIRPKPLLKPLAVLPFANLLKRPYLRRPSIVKPARLPPPSYLTNSAPAMVASASAKLATAAQLLIGQPEQMVAANPIDLSLAYQRGLPAADAVSVAMANKLSNHGYYNLRINEDKLNYGFRTMPVDEHVGKTELIKTVLPEKSLHDLNGPVMEFKPAADRPETLDDLADEAEEDLLEADISEEAAEAVAVRKPSLAELGYGPAHTGYVSELVEYPGLVAEHQGCVFA